MTDHHDFGDHQDDHHLYDAQHHDEPVPFEPPAADDPYDHYAHDDDHYAADHATGDHAAGDPADDHAGGAELHEHADTPAPDAAGEPVHAATVLDDATHDPAEIFPPAVDVGPLPEPVDGFPWIDTGSLGLTAIAAAHDGTTDPVHPAELAEYAGADLPPGVDPWAALAADEDPATSALARFWAEP